MTPVLDSVNRTERPTDWNAVNWQQANRNVRRPRQRIFRATQEQDWNKVQSLQRLMLRSRSNRLVSVRRVTQINQGKRTPGVDKLVVKTPAARGQLVDEMSTYQPWRAKPARRVYIPKANNGRRPLGIPTVPDRVLQAMVKNALEPSWEARFEGTSYGFRPGRGCHDAIVEIQALGRSTGRKRWVIDADIEGAFDNISHEYLLKVIGTVPGRDLIRQWLKAGYMEDNVFHPTEAGTPQGGVISPLLANIALHGLEKALGVKRNINGEIIGNRAVVRYADDFVVFCEDEKDAQKAQQTLTAWLAKRGLTLSKEKTWIVHITEGFDFLGFNVRQYKVNDTPTGYKLLIKPSKKSVQKIRRKLKAEWRRLQGVNAAAVINTLNPIIRGEANYFRMSVATKVFEVLDYWMFRRAVQWIKHTHPKKSRQWCQNQYWGRFNPNRSDNWVFGDKHTGANLTKFKWFSIERHVLVRGTSSPDDPSLQSYWRQRAEKKKKGLSPKEQKLAQNQHGICPMCGETLYNNEDLHVHHKQPRSQGGTDDLWNLVLVHLYCHQQIHSGKRPSRDSQGQSLLLLL